MIFFFKNFKILVFPNFWPLELVSQHFWPQNRIQHPKIPLWTRSEVCRRKFNNRGGLLTARKGYKNIKNIGQIYEKYKQCSCIACILAIFVLYWFPVGFLYFSYIPRIPWAPVCSWKVHSNTLTFVKNSTWNDCIITAQTADTRSRD